MNSFVRCFWGDQEVYEEDNLFRRNLRSLGENSYYLKGILICKIL